MAPILSRNGASGKAGAVHPSNAAMPPGLVWPTSASLIADGVRFAANQLKMGALKGGVIEERHPADDEGLRPFLEAVVQGDEARALRALGFVLGNRPWLLWHPYVRQQLQHLFGVWPHPEAWDIQDRAFEALQRLLEAWVGGITLGKCSVSVVRHRSEHTGPPPRLFPNLFERHGDIETPPAADQRRGAHRLISLYLDLKARLHAAVRWKFINEASRDAEDFWHKIDHEEHAIEKIQAAFLVFTRGWGWENEPPPLQAIGEMFGRSLRIGKGGLPKGRSALDALAYELLATLEWEPLDERERHPAPHEIASTLDTLRRHGFFDLHQEVWGKKFPNAPATTVREVRSGLRVIGSKGKRPPRRRL
jgi:hypothetical protein